MTDVIVVLVILAIIALSIWYIAKEKKKGHACIGCPNASKCSGKNKKKHLHETSFSDRIATKQK